MRVLCAWCLKDGVPESEALLGEKEPKGGIDSHGICPTHRKHVEDKVALLREAAERQRQEAARRQREAERQRQEAEHQQAEAARQRDDIEALRKSVDP
jgi:hypothetical protein